MKGFLYGQTEYNLLACTNRIKEYVMLAKESSFDFLSITDNNLFGNYKFYKCCIDNGIKPLIGLEYSFITEDQNQSKVLLYANNNNGYKDLLKISSIEKTKKPDSLDILKKYQDNISIIFVFNDSFLERLIYSREYSILNEYLNIIKEFKYSYIGISYTNRLDKLELNKQMDDYAKQNGINTLPIHQCKYLKNKNVMVYEALCAIGGNKVKVSDFEDYSFEINPIEDERINKFVNSINLNLFEDKISLPKYPNTKGASSHDFLAALCHKGLQKRNKNNNKYINRLQYELSVINKMGYDDYFLIVWDFIKYAKQNNILVGPGRGSAAGSLVAYCLGITEVDPLAYGLLFERFLNPERISMPDIDTDFPDIERDFIINHVKDLYGMDHVCNISAFGTFLVKSAIRDVARCYNVDNSRVEKIIDMVEKYGFDKLIEEYKGTDIGIVLENAKGIVGLPRHISTHAAGIILSSAPLSDIIPLQEGINGLYQSQLEASDLEKIGLLKMDFLGIRNLTMISGMMSQIKGFDMNKLRNIPLNDPKVYELLQFGDTLGIFQLESRGIRNVLVRLKPTKFEDLVAVLALYRPGPMDNIDDYITAKRTGNIKYLHPNLEPILKETYGIIVYQEQIMKIAQEFAGYSLGEADILRRAVSKKDSHILDELANDFISKSISKGYSKEIAKNIYDLIYKFANYGFNKSHSVAYTILSYQMAYFKANYFPVFMSNILNNVIGTTETMVEYISYAKYRGLITNKPNVNISSNIFVSTKYGLFMPFNSIYSIGTVVSEQIVKEREERGLFKSFEDFKARCSFLSSANLQALIYAGALDLFGKSKKSMCSNSSKEDELFFKHMDDYIEKNDEFDFAYLKEMEHKYLGLNIEYNIFKNIDKYINKYRIISINNLQIDNQTNIVAYIKNAKKILTKNNKPMLVGELEDNQSKIDFVMFSNELENNQFLLEKNGLYIVNGRLKYNNKNELNFIIYNIIEKIDGNAN